MLNLRDIEICVLSGLFRLKEWSTNRASGKKQGDSGPGNYFDGYIEAGFQIATFQGPLCHEPVEGLAYFVESLKMDQEALEQERRTC